jgi:hypothetical protein
MLERFFFKGSASISANVMKRNKKGLRSPDFLNRAFFRNGHRTACPPPGSRSSGSAFALVGVAMPVVAPGQIASQVASFL